MMVLVKWDAVRPEVLQFPFFLGRKNLFRRSALLWHGVVGLLLDSSAFRPFLVTFKL